jgi:hypothetical protein
MVWQLKSAWLSVPQGKIYPRHVGGDSPASVSTMYVLLGLFYFCLVQRRDTGRAIRPAAHKFTFWG